MEVICDDYLRIWWLNFGAPGAKNDIDIFDQSTLFNTVSAATRAATDQSAWFRTHLVLFSIRRHLSS
jgi:Plant transposon protein